MTRTFRSPRTYHPSHSLLGRAFRRWVGDRLRSEALFLVTVSGLILGLLMVHYLGWALLQPMMSGANATEWQIGFWIGQVTSVLLVSALGLIGFRPGVTVKMTADRLTLRQGSNEAVLERDQIERARLISARLYHRHYRLYARTRIFAGRTASEVLLLDTDDGPVVVALESLDDLIALNRHLTQEVSPPTETRAAA